MPFRNPRGGDTPGCGRPQLEVSPAPGWYDTMFVCTGNGIAAVDAPPALGENLIPAMENLMENYLRAAEGTALVKSLPGCPRPRPPAR